MKLLHLRISRTLITADGTPQASCLVGDNTTKVNGVTNDSADTLFA
ncbi:hypothetical protein [Mucilaginibacter sp.]|nr:hypothetical protein [Mucilaginibacter sp.]